MVNHSESFNTTFDKSMDAKSDGSGLSASVWQEKSSWTTAPTERKFAVNEDVYKILSNFSIGDKPFENPNQTDLLGPDKIQEMEQKYGVKFVDDGKGGYGIHVKINGIDDILATVTKDAATGKYVAQFFEDPVGRRITAQEFTFDSFDQMAVGMDAQFTKLVIDKEAEIMKKYNVEVQPAGTAPEGEDLKTNPNWKTRMPRFDELQALDNALFYSMTDAKAESGPLKVFFMDENYKGKPPAQVISENQAKFRTPGIYIGPDHLAETDTVFTGSGVPPAGIRSTFEGMLIHEIAHQGQYLAGDADYESTAEAMGWRKFRIGTSDEWLVKSTQLDTSGQPIYYRFNPRVDGLWHPFDSNGNPLPPDAKTNDGVPLMPIDARAMVNLAFVRPADSYLDRPGEMHASGVAYFRQSDFAREYLLRSSPALYAVIKSWDQRRIGDGNIRLPSGQVVPRTPEAEKSVSDWEAQVNRKTGPIPTCVNSDHC